MNRFLVYLSGPIVENTKMTNAILQALNQIGSARPADFNVYVVETDQGGAAVQGAIRASSPDGGSFFVASVETIAYRGDAQFSSTLRLLGE